MTHPAQASGFSLVEVTVAFAIIGLIIVATSSLLQRIPINGREVRDQDLALKIARNEIEVLRAAGYASLPANGPFVDALLSSLLSGAGSITTSDFNAKTKRADVSVTWVEAQSSLRSVSLTTLIAKDGGL